MATDELVEKRLAKLENQSSLKFFVQYLLSPILLVSIGTFINWRIEENKAESNRVDVAQRMIPTLFAGNPDQAFATERLLAKIVDPASASDLHLIVVKYYQGKIESSLSTGNVELAARIVSAATTIGGSAADEVVKSVANDKNQAERIQGFKTKSQEAAQNEREGFERLISGDYEGAMNAFKAAENAYHSYHQVYELARLIKEKKSELGDPNKRKDFLQVIVTQFAYGAPQDLMERLRAIVAGQPEKTNQQPDVVR